MSLFLLPIDQYYSSLQLSNSYGKTVIQSSKQKFRDIDNENNNFEPKSTKQTNSNIIISQSNEQKQVIFISDLSCDFKALFSIKQNKNKQFLFLQADILTKDNNYYKVSNTFQITQIYRNFISLHASYKNILLCPKLNPSKRQIKIQFPYYSNYTQTDIKNLSQIYQPVNSIFKTLIKPHISLVEFSLKYILKQEEGRGSSQNHIFQKSNKNLQLLKTYCSISHLISHITCQLQMNNSFAQKIQVKQKQNISKIIQKQQALQPQIIKNNHLFSLGFTQLSFRSQIFNFQQLVLNKDRRSKIYFPIPPQNKNPQDNFMVYNKIELKQINQQSLQKISKGGFADIFLTKISYWYPLLSDSKRQTIKTQKNLLQDRVVIKRQIVPNQLFNNSKQLMYQNRKDHQIKIIQKLKKAKSIFLPKYYFPVNLKKINNYFFENCLIIEYIPFKTLGQLLQNNAQYLSLHSKLRLMFNICQGIRYLRDFDIVHLDIKPNNILTYYNYCIKLIDFGQSYHPDVCMKDYKPGFTIPYSPPETFNQAIKMYSSKSDVYSMGVVFYQILFNDYPFQIFKSTTKYGQQMKQNLEQGWYYSPEQKQSYGDRQILRILMNLISRCLSFNQDQRPELDWVAIILGHMLQIVP